MPPPISIPQMHSASQTTERFSLESLANQPPISNHHSSPLQASSSCARDEATSRHLAHPHPKSTSYPRQDMTTLHPHLMSIHHPHNSHGHRDESSSSTSEETSWLKRPYTAEGDATYLIEPDRKKQKSSRKQPSCYQQLQHCYQLLRDNMKATYENPATLGHPPNTWGNEDYVLVPVWKIRETDEKNKMMSDRMKTLLCSFRQKSNQLATLNVTLRSLVEMLLKSSNMELTLAKQCAGILSQLPKPVVEPPFPVYPVPEPSAEMSWSPHQ